MLTKKQRAIKINKNNLNAGHRQRCREKFVSCRDSMKDYELIEMILFLAFPRRDTKNVAKILMDKFKNITNLINADIDQLKSVDGIGDSVICVLKLFQEVHLRMLKENIEEDNIKLNSTENVVKYCKSKIGHLVHEEVLILFIDNSGNLVYEDIISSGNADEVNVYKNLIITKATQNGACGIIMVHNHPSGSAKPSQADIELTTEMYKLLQQVNMSLVDHVIVSRNDIYSFVERGMINKIRLLK